MNSIFKSFYLLRFIIYLFIKIKFLFISSYFTLGLLGALHVEYLYSHFAYFLYFYQNRLLIPWGNYPFLCSPYESLWMVPSVWFAAPLVVCHLFPFPLPRLANYPISLKDIIWIYWCFESFQWTPAGSGSFLLR